MQTRSLVDVSDLIGLPYKPHGRDESGIDCFGLIWLIAMRNGTPIPDVWYRRSDPALMKLSSKMSVEKTDVLSPGCVIEMVKNGRLHLGYALDSERMVHATRTDGVIVEDIIKYPVKGYYRFK